MAELANQEDQLNLLLDGARYGDAQDVRAALDDYKLSPDEADERGRTALHMASANGHAEVVQLLLDRGANPEPANEEQNTPLHWACLNGQDQVTRLLMEKGASASVLNAQGRTPVDEALGTPVQDRILATINSFGKATDGMDCNEDPESGEMEDATAEEPDPALKIYNKYGSDGS